MKYDIIKDDKELVKILKKYGIRPKSEIATYTMYEDVEIITLWKPYEYEVRIEDGEVVLNMKYKKKSLWTSIKGLDGC